MQEFLTNNVVNWNLMSLTGYRTLVILEALIESPKSNDEINDYLYNNQHIGERFSSDTLRLYINSLRAIGCEITPANKSNNKKYQLISHPFEYDISKSELNAISKIYKSIYDKIDIREIILLENFLEKLTSLIKNETTKKNLSNISMLKHIDRKILDDLIVHCKNNNQITFMYNSPKSGHKEIEIIADKLSFKSEKLYLWGKNLTHNEYSYFPVERILKISSINILKNKEFSPCIRVIYEIYLQDNDSFMPESYENIIEKTNEKLVIEVNSKNEFCIMQRVLYLGCDCKVIEPFEFKSKLVERLKLMDKFYE